MRKGRERSKCDCILCKYVTLCSVFVLYEIKMENQKKKKKKFFLSNWEYFVWNWEKSILFGIGNGAEFRPQNRVIESPEMCVHLLNKIM